MIRATGLALLLVSALACTSSEDMTLLHREITDVQREVQRLANSSLDQENFASMERRMQDLTQKNMRSNADLAQRVESLQGQIEALHASLEMTTRQLQSISQELAASRAQLVARPVLPPVMVTPDTDPTATTEGAGADTAVATETAEASPDELYRTAYEDYMRGNYDLASQGFREYLRRFPDTELSDNSLYWIGECLDAQDQSDEALEVFSQVLETYPNSDKAAAAQLKKGLLYLKKGDNGQGVVHLQYVVYEHPGSKEADLARERLRSLGLTIR